MPVSGKDHVSATNHVHAHPHADVRAYMHGSVGCDVYSVRLGSHIRKVVKSGGLVQQPAKAGQHVCGTARVRPSVVHKCITSETPCP